jgi:hypothetical protein
MVCLITIAAFTLTHTRYSNITHMNTLGRHFLIKVLLKQPTEAEYIELDQALGLGYERNALVGLTAPGPTFERLNWGEYWLANTTSSASRVEQHVREALVSHADNIYSLKVQVVNDPNVAGYNLTWEEGWQKLRSA